MATTTYEPIQTYTVSGSATNTITLGSGGTIPQTYTDLILVGNPIVSASLDYKWYVNGDNTSGLYSQTRLLGNGSSATSTRTTGANFLYLDATAPASGSMQNFIMNFQNYANTSVYKTVLVRYNDAGTETSARVGLWRNTNAVSSITISTDSSTFAAGSTFTLYGIANAAIGAPKAQGGVITYDSTYYYHTFGASGTFTPQQSLTADILVVAGGGGGATNTSAGGSGGNGGGGAGGLRLFASQSLTTTAYTCTVGAGGAGATSSAASGNNGVNSSFAGSGFTTINTTGGGGGAGTGSNNGSAGGSGGGGYGYPLNTYNGGAGNNGGYTPVEGYAGARGYTDGATYTTGGGGGGSAAAATQKTSNIGGDGGAGTQLTAWSNTTGTGASGYYAGGGGGGSGLGASSLGLGSAGGGNGSLLGTNASNALANTGSGGGGVGGGSSSVYAGGNGGSGVVIIRYLKA
jgi:hypothetical protein